MLRTDFQAIWCRDGREKDERVIGWPSERAEPALGVLACGESESSLRTSTRTRSAAARSDESVRTGWLMPRRPCQRWLASPVPPGMRGRFVDAASSHGCSILLLSSWHTRGSMGVSQHLLQRQKRYAPAAARASTASSLTMSDHGRCVCLSSVPFVWIDEEGGSSAAAVASRSR